MDKDENLIWQFDELIKTLIVMSMPYESQSTFYGIGITADELCEDFYSYYGLIKNRLLEADLIDVDSKKTLDNIDDLIERWTVENKPRDFWCEMQKYEDDWSILRQQARDALSKLRKTHFTVQVQHKYEFDNDGKIISQKTKTELKQI